MKVISFHSFKGGRGRTTAIANLANLYARLGRHVVLLDADVTAPWLHTRYSLPGEGVHSRGWLRGLLDELAETPQSVVPNCDLDAYWVPIEPVAGTGSIRLLAPGDPDVPDYWEWVADKFPRFMGLRRNPHIVESWRDLRLLIANAEPKPDVMFVDAPAGYHEASAFVAIGLADTAVVFAGADEADTKWTTTLVEMIRTERTVQLRGRYGDLRVVAVRGRYPNFFHTRREAESEFGVFRQRFAHLDFDDAVSLDSDPRLELSTPTLTIPLEGEVRETPLALSYSRLLKTVLPEAQFVDHEPLSMLPDGTVVPGESPNFFWLEDHGVLTNPADHARNVAFRVETFCGLLDDLHGDLMGEGRDDDGQHGGGAGQALRNAGSEPGLKFGVSLNGLLGPAVSQAERLVRWCEFDSRVGFGHLTMLDCVEDSEHRVVAGEVEVRGNFLAAGRSDPQPDLCPLMSGYIEGVLSELLSGGAPPQVDVLHPAESCMRWATADAGRHACRFRFSVVW